MSQVKKEEEEEYEGVQYERTQSSADERAQSGSTSQGDKEEEKKENGMTQGEKEKEKENSMSQAEKEKEKKENSMSQGEKEEDKKENEGVQHVNSTADERAQSESSSAEEGAQSGTQGEKEEEEEEECGFCLFMKGGPCGQRFTLWQECVDGAEKSEQDIVQQCAQMTSLLKVCMEMNPQYYGPVLDAEKTMEAEVSSLEANSGDDKSRETSAGGGEGVPSAHGGETVEAVEVLEVVVDDKGQVVEVVDDVELKEAAG